MLSGWDFYRISTSLKLHFTTEQYDCVKTGGAVRSSLDVFNRRHDVGRYHTFADKLFNKTKAGHFVIANLMNGSSNYIYESFDDGYDIYLKWLKIRDSITRELEKDVEYIDGLAVSRGAFNLFDKTKSGNFPPILQMALGKHINVETVIILNKEHKEFLPQWEELTKADPYVSKMILKWKKYQPFVQYDKEKISTILKGLQR